MCDRLSYDKIGRRYTKMVYGHRFRSSRNISEQAAQAQYALWKAQLPTEVKPINRDLLISIVGEQKADAIIAELNGENDPPQVLPYTEALKELQNNQQD